MSNQIQLRKRASYSYCARSRRQQTNPSRKKIFHRVENVIKPLVHTSAVPSSRYEALGKFGEHLLSVTPRATLHIFHALQTSSVLHISSTARWRMNQLLIVSLGRCRRSSCEIRAGSSSVAHRQRAFRAWIQVFNFLSLKDSRNRWIVENEWAQWINFHMPCKYCLHAFHIANFTCILSFHMHVISHPVCWKLVFKM